MMERTMIWMYEGDNWHTCRWCGRPPYTRRDGQEYLYSYDGGPAVCSPRCHKKIEAQRDEAAANIMLGHD
jgi:hypothetical protein